MPKYWNRHSPGSSLLKLSFQIFVHRQILSSAPHLDTFRVWIPTSVEILPQAPVSRQSPKIAHTLLWSNGNRIAEVLHVAPPHTTTKGNRRVRLPFLTPYSPAHCI